MKKILITNIIGKIVKIPKDIHSQFLTDFENSFRVEIFGENGLKNNPQMGLKILRNDNDTVSYCLTATSENLLDKVIIYLRLYSD